MQMFHAWSQVGRFAMVSRFCFVCEISTPCDSLGRLTGYMLGGGVHVLLKQGIEIYVLTFFYFVPNGARDWRKVMGGQMTSLERGCGFLLVRTACFGCDGGEMFERGHCCWIVLWIPCCTNYVMMA